MVSDRQSHSTLKTKLQHMFVGKGTSTTDSSAPSMSGVATIAPSSITFYPAPHKAEEFRSSRRVQVDNAKEENAPLTLLRKVYKGEKEPMELLGSSIPQDGGSPFLHDVLPQRNGLVHTIIEAYNNHRALVLRPDDVWLAILTQFNFFVNGNAEHLRRHFVSHEGKEELSVTSIGSRYTADFSQMARKMTELLEKRVVDPDLRSWLLPTFSTTTLLDTTIYAIVMMASLKEYFSYKICLMCGIPQVTLEGTKQDWESLLARLEKLKEYGEETEAWSHLLKPIISRFVAAYDDPDNKENHDFWNKVASIKSRGSGPRYLAGWITAFCYFTAKGAKTPAGGGGLIVDGVSYAIIDTSDIPAGVAEVDVLLDDNGNKFDSLLVAGSVGTQICADAKSVRNTVRPFPAWWYMNMGPRK